ncbi:MAG TPA: YkgJ family cysteine cluster protein [Nitrospiraceae bacterium]|nr:YkgJ family cysteine cluster protein [Nitrospiraceae bacterium]
MAERFDIVLNTPAGQLSSALDVPTGFVPITAIVPAMRRLGEEAERLEEHRAAEAGKAISCRMGCAACCRMLVPLSPPEAFALKEYVDNLPVDRRNLITRRLTETKQQLQEHGLLDQLSAVAEGTEARSDEDFEPLNRAYYSLRMPCPFLELEMCSIYEARPAACRELLVTSPAEWCQDLVRNPVQPLPVPIRMGSVLGLLWAELTDSVPRLIPLPVAMDWADRHQAENQPRWQGTTLLDRALDKVWRFLSQAFNVGQEVRGERQGVKKTSSL